MPDRDQGAPTRGRLPFQVLVVPFMRTPDAIQYAVFRRADAGYWQFIAGGGQDDETAAEAAGRESWEEAGIPPDSPLVPLQSTASIHVTEIVGDFLWGPEVLVIPEHAFGVEVHSSELRLSDEHTAYRWVDFAAARAMLRWDSNRTALWELDRLIGMDDHTARL